MRKLIFFAIGTVLLGACSPKAIEPFYTDLNKALNLRSGMNRDEARTTLGVYPFDIMHNQFDGCEIHQYLYQDRMREVSSRVWPKDLTRGKQNKSGRNELYLIFRDNSLETFFSGSGKDAKPLLELKDDLMFVCNNSEFVDGPVYGCTDITSLNYNEKVTHDDGSCEYCPCEQVKNPLYDAKRKCGARCISEAEYKRLMKLNEGEKDCNLCEILEQGMNSTSGKVEINLNVSPADLQRGTAPAVIVIPAVPSQPAAPILPKLFKKKKGKSTSMNISPTNNTSGFDSWGRTIDQNMASSIITYNNYHFADMTNSNINGLLFNYSF